MALGESGRIRTENGHIAWSECYRRLAAIRDSGNACSVTSATGAAYSYSGAFVSGSASDCCRSTGHHGINCSGNAECRTRYVGISDRTRLRNWTCPGAAGERRTAAHRDMPKRIVRLWNEFGNRGPSLYPARSNRTMQRTESIPSVQLRRGAPQDQCQWSAQPIGTTSSTHLPGLPATRRLPGLRDDHQAELGRLGRVDIVSERKNLAGRVPPDRRIQ